MTQHFVAASLDSAAAALQTFVTTSGCCALVLVVKHLMISLIVADEWATTFDGSVPAVVPAPSVVAIEVPAAAPNRAPD